MSSKIKSRVVVAMSGGVDSSVAAALLKEQGFDVIGVSLKLWDYVDAEKQCHGKTCCSLEDIADAKEVCDVLQIPFYAFNYKSQFKKSVIDPFVEEYCQGRTPNPCILCNQHIKFNRLLSEAEKMGAEYLATGHYARVETDEKGVCHLLKGVDPQKDQSYVLFHLSQKELSKILFPIGHYTKDQIREVARKYNLGTHNKRESMDICFIPEQDHLSFIAKNYPEKKNQEGNFVDWKGRVLGQHMGIEAYTVGQRKGMGLSFSEKMYVAQIRSETNEVVLAPEEDLYFGGVIAEGFHFLQVLDKRTYGAKLRYQKDEIPSEIVDYQEKTGRIRLKFHEKARAVTPGQAVVLYDGAEVMGGGWIKQSVR